MSAPGSDDAPAISPLVLRWFNAYTRRYLARHFHGVRLSLSGAPRLDLNRSAIIYFNHPSWWDPLLCLQLAAECFPGRPCFAPMDAAQLRRFGFFRKIGIFGVEPGTRRGATDFLRLSSQALGHRGAMLWITPQARFADARERPLGFAGGLARLARAHPEAQFVPLAIEYLFWNERLPEALARFGPVERACDALSTCSDNASLTAHLESCLEQTMAQLADDALRRDPTAFRSLLEGRSGISRFYDLWQRAKATIRT